MSSEQLLDVLKQFHDYSKAPYWSSFFQSVTYLSPLIALLSIFVAYFAVNRTQKKNKENDNDKVIRELRLKAADDFIEAISNVKMSFHDTVAVKQVWEIYLCGQTNTATLENYIDKCISEQYKSTLMMAIQFKKRKIILKEYERQVEHIYETGSKMGRSLTLFKTYLSQPNTNKTRISELISDIESNSKGLNDHLNKLLIIVQDNFIGKILQGED
ncbi:hypothetical protein GCM10010912_17770 [Paenibacillus albidus]|uniref:Uncharacterized protein n=1 Tax=Paenibacillus albidus TaxID=2041023 RepID=A0A917C7R0_9BACL|nr:hypothetical protein [Paenibacillus albidus]GGF72993.1 hypothetical protein GCM10010912_17770 [Paenibacillus albidus]